MDKLLGVWPTSAIVYIVFIVLSAGGVDLAALCFSLVFWWPLYTENILIKFYNCFIWEDRYIFLTVVAHASNLVCIYSFAHILWEAMHYSNLIAGVSDYFTLVFLISTPISTITHLFYRKKIIAS